MKTDVRQRIPQPDAKERASERGNKTLTETAGTDLGFLPEEGKITSSPTTTYNNNNE
jgi:hypothetical protein